MTILTSIYPALSERQPLPSFYTPLAIFLSLLPFLTKNYNNFLTVSAFLILLYLCASWPCFTTGDPSADLYNNSHFVALPLWYVDFVFLTPWRGKDAPAFVGPLEQDKRKHNSSVPSPQRWEGLNTFSQRLKWALRLIFPPAHRGIGWNWQVKGVPEHPDAKLSKTIFVRNQLWSAVLFYVLCVAALIALGLSNAVRVGLDPERDVLRAISTAMLGWTGATWVWARLCCSYNLAAAICVGIGLTQSWEWPPLMGSLRDAWGVRQMWSVTYHQVCRRLLSQPANRIVRFLRLRKGSLASRYIQLLLTFSISCLFHQAQMFNVTRRDMGERAFFLSQPLAIMAEDIVIWTWKNTGFSGKAGRFETFGGYLWTLIWFSFSLHFYVGGLVQAHTMKDWVLGYQPLWMGERLGEGLLPWLRE